MATFDTEAEARNVSINLTDPAASYNVLDSAAEICDLSFLIVSHL
jgi:hypothetical protein